MPSSAKELIYTCWFYSTGYKYRFVKGAASRNVNKRLSKRRFTVFLIGHITVIFHNISHNESVILKIESCTS